MFLNHFSGGEKRQRLEVIGSIYRFMALTEGLCKETNGRENDTTVFQGYIYTLKYGGGNIQALRTFTYS